MPARVSAVHRTPPDHCTTGGGAVRGLWSAGAPADRITGAGCGSLHGHAAAGLHSRDGRHSDGRRPPSAEHASYPRQQQSAAPQAAAALSGHSLESRGQCRPQRHAGPSMLRLGGPLARMEAEAVLRELVARVERTSRAGPAIWSTNSSLRCSTKLPVRLHKN